MLRYAKKRSNGAL